MRRFKAHGSEFSVSACGESLRPVLLNPEPRTLAHLSRWKARRQRRSAAGGLGHAAGASNALPPRSMYACTLHASSRKHGAWAVDREASTGKLSHSVRIYAPRLTPRGPRSPSPALSCPIAVFGLFRQDTHLWGIAESGSKACRSIHPIEGFGGSGKDSMGRRSKFTMPGLGNLYRSRAGQGVIPFPAVPARPAPRHATRQAPLGQTSAAEHGPGPGTSFAVGRRRDEGGRRLGRTPPASIPSAVSLRPSAFRLRPFSPVPRWMPGACAARLRGNQFVLVRPGIQRVAETGAKGLKGAKGVKGLSYSSHPSHCSHFFRKEAK